MKHRLIVLCVLLLCLASPALAQGRVVDGADLFTSAEEAEFEANIAAIADAYAFDVAIVSTNDSQGKAANIYAADFFEAQGYGYGERGDGILFAFCMDLKEYFTDTHGWGIDAFTDNGLDELHGLMTPDLRDGAYAQAMRMFLEYIPRFLDEAAAGTPYDTNHPLIVRSIWARAASGLLVVVIAAFVIALICVLVMRSKLLTAKKQIEAGNYLKENSLEMTEATDLFLYRTQTRRKIEKSSSGGGGSSTFESSSGDTHGGRGGSL